MKIQIVNWRITPVSAEIDIKLEGLYGGMTRLVLPTHEVLTEESLKAAIKTALEAAKVMEERMAILKLLMFKEIEID